ncbi:tRNA (adenosine(37)-N6)-threonylcarbamoyltransferase complex ATPase subunit type 1 TsaE [Jannaschia sp. W003]|uniref:tRNA (adenosine(37)-N6)-threonylcarbamoyltransferase complex ATPase subunit type 1 TsaE n=1 Tax=Jannaschia sp. W003 TaxID=2867012 RepID=UPI0021A400E7|nr:tRNA (adenosine(37)-N6)-threonylcarbamoyltransferase complex ATPase subunit type 1 TsaE [Jannaschia sp. W003]UWQ21613.1 tRNA (adenosine(37)-N6)-threonylcarbamoyltransferase complex ATPase subunit type 1 TsaE [Jannaschia sp. W003]
MTDLLLSGPGATEALGRRLARALRPGDALLLAGPTGAGKSLLARALIQEAQRRAGREPEAVPSPTYTLVQTYRAGPLEIWHADLYRLASADELWELGLAEAFDTAAALIEWPDRLGADRPSGAVDVTLALSEGGAARTARLEGPESTLARLLGPQPAGVPA